MRQARQDLDFVFGFIILEQGDIRYPQFSGLGNVCEVSLPVE